MSGVKTLHPLASTLSIIANPAMLDTCVAGSLLDKLWMKVKEDVAVGEPKRNDSIILKGLGTCLQRLSNHAGLLRGWLTSEQTLNKGEGRCCCWRTKTKWQHHLAGIRNLSSKDIQPCWTPVWLAHFCKQIQTTILFVVFELGIKIMNKLEDIK